MSIAPEQTWQEAIGELFTTRREKLGLRIHDVAFKVGVAGTPVTSDVVGRIMRGESKRPSPIHLGAIAEVLGIDQSEWMSVARDASQGGESVTARYLRPSFMGMAA